MTQESCVCNVQGTSKNDVIQPGGEGVRTFVTGWSKGQAKEHF